MPAVPPGVEQRFRKLVRAIKAHPNYNTAIGQALGIEAPTQAVPDLAALTPVLRLTITGGQVVIQSSWQGQSKFLDQIEFQVDRGTGQGFQWLAYSTLPKHRDTTPFPATAAKWSYRAIYRVGDSRVGQWSAIASVTVVA